MWIMWFSLVGLHLQMKPLWVTSLLCKSVVQCLCYNEIVGAKHNNNGNKTKRNWIILLNIINLKRKITQHYLDWGVALALFKEIQALGWLSFVTGADILWLVSWEIQQSNKFRIARTTSAQSVQTQSSTRKNTLFLLEPFYMLVYKNACIC